MAIWGVTQYSIFRGSEFKIFPQATSFRLKEKSNLYENTGTILWPCNSSSFDISPIRNKLCIQKEKQLCVMIDNSKFTLVWSETLFQKWLPMIMCLGWLGGYNVSWSWCYRSGYAGNLTQNCAKKF